MTVVGISTPDLVQCPELETPNLLEKLGEVGVLEIFAQRLYRIETEEIPYLLSLHQQSEIVSYQDFMTALADEKTDRSAALYKKLCQVLKVSQLSELQTEFLFKCSQLFKLEARDQARLEAKETP